MIVLLGATGYVGKAFVRELQERGSTFECLSRSSVDYTQFRVLRDYLQDRKPEFLINAAGYTGKPNVDACETRRADTLWGNALFPQTVAQACEVTGTPWGHVSSGCIYTGAWVERDGQCIAEKDLTQPDLWRLATETPSAIHGFVESDPPNFSFRQPPCSFYSGTKALGEEAIRNVGPAYIWRLRIPFDEEDNGRNYLSKLMRYSKVYQNINSISHRTDFVRVCLDLWKTRAPLDTYNVTNEGWITTGRAVEWIQKVLRPSRSFEFWSNDEEFYRVAAATPRSNCVLDIAKLKATGVAIRSVEEALEDALKNWKKES